MIDNINGIAENIRHILLGIFFFNIIKVKSTTISKIVVDIIKIGK